MTSVSHPSPRERSALSRAKAQRTSSHSSASGESQAPRDFVEIAKAYAKEAVADKRGKRFGKWLRLAAERFLADLKRAQQRDAPFVFDAVAAGRFWILPDPSFLPMIEQRFQSVLTGKNPGDPGLDA